MVLYCRKNRLGRNRLGLVSSTKDLAAVGGSHSLAEAMDLLAVELLGLIGTFRCHVETPPVRFPSALRRHLLDTSGDRRRSKHISAYL